MLDTHRAPARTLLPRSRGSFLPSSCGPRILPRRLACVSPPPTPAVSRRCQRQLLSQPGPSWVEAGADRSLWGRLPRGPGAGPALRREEGVWGGRCLELGHCGSWACLPRAGQGLGEGEAARPSHPGLWCGPRGSGGALCWCGGHYEGNLVSGCSEPPGAQLRSKTQDLLGEETGRGPQREEGMGGPWWPGGWGDLRLSLCQTAPASRSHRLLGVLPILSQACPPLSHGAQPHPKWPPSHLHPRSPGSGWRARNSIGATSSHLESWGKSIP